MRYVLCLQKSDRLSKKSKMRSLVDKKSNAIAFQKKVKSDRSSIKNQMRSPLYKKRDRVASKAFSRSLADQKSNAIAPASKALGIAFAVDLSLLFVIHRIRRKPTFIGLSEF